MSTLRSLALGGMIAVLFLIPASASPYVSAYPTTAAVTCHSDQSCSALGTIQIEDDVIGGAPTISSYVWQASGAACVSMVTFTPSGTTGHFCQKPIGASSNGVGALTPAQYGAVCDGSTVDTTAIRALYTAAGAAHGVYIPLTSGLCRIDKVTLNSHTHTFFAPGAGFKLIDGSTNGEMFEIPDGTMDVTWTGPGVIDGNSANNTGHIVDVFHFAGTSTGGFVWDGLTFNDIAGSPIELWGAVPQPVFRHLTFNHWGLPTGVNIFSTAILYHMTTNAADIQGPIIDDVTGYQPDSMAVADTNFITVREPDSYAYQIIGAQYRGIKYVGPKCTYAGIAGCGDSSPLRIWYNKKLHCVRRFFEGRGERPRCRNCSARSNIQP